MRRLHLRLRVSSKVRDWCRGDSVLLQLGGRMLRELGEVSGLLGGEGYRNETLLVSIDDR